MGSRLLRAAVAWAAAALLTLTAAGAAQLVPLEDYIEQADVAKDPAALCYVASRCSALYSVVAKNLEDEIDPDRQKFKAEALSAGEMFMGIAMKSMMSGTTIEIKPALARTSKIVVEMGNVYTDRISTARVYTNNMFSDTLIAGDRAVCKGLRNLAG